MNKFCEYFTDYFFVSENNSINVMTAPETIGDRIRKARNHRKPPLSQEDLAAKVGVSQVALSKIERGKTKNPDRGLLMKIAEVLGVSAAWLSYGSQELEELSKKSINMALIYNGLSSEKQQLVDILLESLEEKKQADVTPIKKDNEKS